MQGKKKYTPKVFYQLSLDALVPEDNFYRKVQAELALDFLYKATRNYYGNEGQASINPVVFFKDTACWLSQQYQQRPCFAALLQQQFGCAAVSGMDKNYTRFLTKRRSSRVEPVLGTLINHDNMKKVNARGTKNANKHLLMLALTYNLKKYLKFINRKIHRNFQMMNLSKGKFGFWRYLLATASPVQI